MRYLLASHEIFYWSIKRRFYDWGKSEFIARNPGTLSEFLNAEIIPKGLLVRLEASSLVAYPGNKHKILLSWSIITLKVASGCSLVDV